MATDTLLDRHIRETFGGDRSAPVVIIPHVPTKLTVCRSLTGRPGAYVVTEIPAIGGRLGVIYPQWYVSPKTGCNCGRAGCEHAAAVARYLEDK